MSRFVLCYKLVSDTQLWQVLNAPTLEDCVRHIENYPLERSAFFVVEVTDSAFDYQTRMLGDRVKNLKPVFVGGKDDPTPFMPKPVVKEVGADTAVAEVKKSTKQNAVAQRAASLAAKEAKLAAAGGEVKEAPAKQDKGAKADAKTAEKKSEKVEKPQAKGTVEKKTELETKSSKSVTAPKLTSSAVSFNGRAVVWAAKGPSSSLSPEDRKLFCESVDAALRQGVGISQGCHDQYVQSCLALDRSVVPVAGEGPASSLTKVEGGVLKFQGGQTKADVTTLSDPEADAFLKSVEHSITSGRGVSQAAHDKYVTLCVARGRPVAHVVDPNAPKDTPKPASSSSVSSGASASASSTTTSTHVGREAQQAAKPAQEKRNPVTSAPEGKQVTFKMSPPQSASPQVLESESFDAFQGRKATGEASRAIGGGAEGSVDQLQGRAAAQQSRIHQLMETLDKEITRQMNDQAEIQRLRIANARLVLDNARLEALKR